MYDFAFPGAETDDSSGMIGFLFQTAFFQFFISESAFVRERLIELDDKVIFEVLGYSATVTGGIADDFIFFRNYFYVRTLVESIYNNVRMLVFGKSEAEQDCTLRRVCLNPLILLAVYVYCHPSPILPVCGVQKFIPHGRAMAG